MTDSSGRNPFDLIQEDFPATSSNIYSNRLLESRFEEATNDNRINVATKTLSQHNLVNNSLEHAGLSMYVTVSILL